MNQAVMTTLKNNYHIHELELMYWDTVIQVLSTWQNVHQPVIGIQNTKSYRQEKGFLVEYILVAAAGLGLGIIIGAVSRLL